MTSPHTTLLDRIRLRQARVGVIGLGYVGLPLVVEFARAGFDVTGFDVDRAKTDAINGGQSYIPDVPESDVASLSGAGRLRATTDMSQLAGMDAIDICVPTPLRKTKDPDLSYVVHAVEAVAATLKRGQLVILESTTYPGTTDEVVQPMLTAQGFTPDVDFFLAFSPERVDPGNPQFLTHNIPKVVGGVTQDSTEVAAHIPIDPFYLSWKARQSGFECRFIELAGQVNGAMPEYVVQLVAEALNSARKALNGSRVHLFGMAYKPNVGDVRESPALDILELLKRQGALVSYTDPYVATLKHGSEILRSIPEAAALATNADCYVICTNHDVFDYAAIGSSGALLVDTRNALKDRNDPTIFRL
jgi:UDP-N-acetyl-D-mannosaminuronate dehydrogenase